MPGSFELCLAFGSIQHGLQRLNESVGLRSWQELYIRHSCTYGSAHEGEQGGEAACCIGQPCIRLPPERPDLFGWAKWLEVSGLALQAQLGHVWPCEQARCCGLLNVASFIAWLNLSAAYL